MARILESEFYLVASQSGRFGKLSIRMTSKQPSLSPGEVPIKAVLKIPAALFDRPQFKMTIEIPETEAREISATMPGQIAAALKENLGIVVQILPANENQL